MLQICNKLNLIKDHVGIRIENDLYQKYILSFAFSWDPACERRHPVKESKLTIALRGPAGNLLAGVLAVF